MSSPLRVCMGVAWAALGLWMVPAWPQSAPLLQVQVGPDNALHIHNNYTASVTAYLVKAEISLPTRTIAVGAPLDSMENPQPLIPAGAGVDWPLGTTAASSQEPARPYIAAATSIQIADQAVIYADGATAGNPRLVEAFLRVRGYELSELRRSQAILARLESTSDWSVTQDQLNQEAAGDDRARLEFGPHWGVNFLRNLALKLDYSTTDPEQRQQWLAVLRRRYDNFAARLAESRPAPIPPAANPEAASGSACGPAGGNNLALTCTTVGKQLQVLARNVRNTAAGYFAVGLLVPTATGFRPMVTQNTDAVAFPGGAALQPGMERLMTLPIPPSVTLAGQPQLREAVIYEDGATAGDPELVRQELAFRAAERDDLREVIPILGAAAANPAVDRDALIAQFDQRAQAWRTAMQAATRAHPGNPAFTAPDMVCLNVAMQLRIAAHDGSQSLPRILADTLQRAQAALQRLESSRPPLPEAAPQPGAHE